MGGGRRGESGRFAPLHALQFRDGVPLLAEARPREVLRMSARLDALCGHQVRLSIRLRTGEHCDATTHIEG